MKKLFLFIAFYSAMLIANAGIIEKTWYFNDYKITNSGEYQIISFDNTFLTGKTGEPVLPYSSVSLLLPPGEVAKTIEIILEDQVYIPGNFLLYPQQPSQPLSKPGNVTFIRNEQVYNTNSLYPARQTGELLTEYMNGYSIALSSFTPVRYNPVSGELSYYKKVIIKITTESSPVSVNALQNLNSSGKSIKRVKQFIQNPSLVSQYPSQAKSEDDYGLLIITPAQFENNFQGLIDIYLVRGIKTEVVTKEFISANSSGQDMQEKIRNYIIQEYQDHSVEYVLLGGDAEHIPYRGFYCYVQSGSGYEDNNIPADLYYSGLDGTWNDDNDGSWGEEGEDDLLPDIAVARFPFSNTTELNNMINKSVSYQNNPVLGELTSPLLAGEHLWSSPETWGADYMDLLIGYQDENGYVTVGIPEDQNIETLYERDASWSGSNLIAKINQGKQFVHHCGHANETYVAHLTNSDITNSNFSGANGSDHNYTFLQTHGCNCGDFTYNDCILEKMVTIENFAVAVIGNSRYGWFNEGQTEGPAAHLHREMVDAMYNEKLNHIGAAFVECKTQTAPWVTAPGQWEEGALRWNFYDINILGDPALSVWTDEPIDIDVDHLGTYFMGVDSYEVTVTSGGEPMENFHCAVLFDGELVGIGLTDENGFVAVGMELITNTGDAELIVSGYNCLPHLYDVMVAVPGPSFIYIDDYQINDETGNGNGEFDYGESVTMDLTLGNIGTEPAENVEAEIETIDPYVTITDGFESFGSIGSNGTETVSDAFSLEVADNVPDQHMVIIDATLSWTDDFVITQIIEIINSPVLSPGSVSVDDTQNGNGNGMLDPGETADIEIEIWNTGHSTSEDIVCNISSTSPFVTINTSNCTVGAVSPGNSAIAVFTIEIDESTPTGQSVDLFAEFTAGNYMAQQNYLISVGLVFEDFETGDFTNMAWEFGGSAPWVISTQNPYEGDYCAESGNINDNQTSDLFVTMDVLADGEISFFRKVSSESGWDYLRFFIDGVQKDEWSGEESWQEFSYPVTSGTHTFKWTYYKDGSVSTGSDCGWLDYIIFPGASGSGNPLSVSVTANPDEICIGENSQLNANATGGSGDFDYEWTPTTGLSDPSISNPVASPSETTTYTVNVSDGASNISGQITITVYTVPETPVITQQDDHLHSTAVDGNQWYDSDGAIAGATNQTYYPNATNDYYVIVSNSYDCESEPSNVIYFIYSGLKEFEGSSDIRLFPNPTTGKFTVEFSGNYGMAKIRVMNMMNEVVFESTTEIVTGKSLNVNLSNISAGVYFVKINTSDIEIIRKIMIQ